MVNRRWSRPTRSASSASTNAWSCTEREVHRGAMARDCAVRGWSFPVDSRRRALRRAHWPTRRPRRSRWRRAGPALREVIGLIGGAGQVIDVNRLVGVLERQGQAAQIGEVPRDWSRSTHCRMIAPGFRAAGQALAGRASARVSRPRAATTSASASIARATQDDSVRGRSTRCAPPVAATVRLRRGRRSQPREAPAYTTVAVSECPGPRHVS
jgi:hypothetical protein